MLEDINMIYEDTQIHNACNVNFLGLIIDSTLSWKDDITQLAEPYLCYVSAEFSDGLLHLCTFQYVLRNYILGQLEP
jgi:hypothetical protein